MQRFTVNTEKENGFWTMRVIFQKLIPLSMAITISIGTMRIMGSKNSTSVWSKKQEISKRSGSS